MTLHILLTTRTDPRSTNPEVVEASLKATDRTAIVACKLSLPSWINGEQMYALDDHILARLHLDHGERNAAPQLDWHLAEECWQNLQGSWAENL